MFVSYKLTKNVPPQPSFFSADTTSVNIFCGWQLSPSLPFFVEKSCAVNNKTTLFLALAFPKFQVCFRPRFFTCLPNAELRVAEIKLLVKLCINANLQLQQILNLTSLCYFKTSTIFDNLTNICKLAEKIFEKSDSDCSL